MGANGITTFGEYIEAAEAALKKIKEATYSNPPIKRSDLTELYHEQGKIVERAGEAFGAAIFWDEPTPRRRRA